jgi:hypothetical protein
MKQSKRRLSKGVTVEQLQQFWNHRINPITGFYHPKSDSRTVEDRKQAYHRSVKRNEL